MVSLAKGVLAELVRSAGDAVVDSGEDPRYLWRIYGGTKEKEQSVAFLSGCFVGLFSSVVSIRDGMSTLKSKIRPNEGSSHAPMKRAKVGFVSDVD